MATVTKFEVLPIHENGWLFLQLVIEKDISSIFHNIYLIFCALFISNSFRFFILHSYTYVCLSIPFP